MGDWGWLSDSGAHKVVDLLILNYSATAILGIDGGKFFNKSKALRNRIMTQLLLIYAHGLQEVYLDNYSMSRAFRRKKSFIGPIGCDVP